MPRDYNGKETNNTLTWAKENLDLHLSTHAFLGTRQQQTLSSTGLSVILTIILVTTSVKIRLNPLYRFNSVTYSLANFT